MSQSLWGIKWNATAQLRNIPKEASAGDSDSDRIDGASLCIVLSR
jgi:hypothetical protein